MWRCFSFWLKCPSETKGSTTREGSGTDGILGHERNWSELPQEILHLFSKKLPDISDFIRFRVVCKSWELSAPINDPPPQLPWLLEHCHDCENGIIRFYCLSSGKVHTFTCPASRVNRFMGPAFRYLLLEQDFYKIYLLNPLTHDQIHAPFLNLIYGYPDYIVPDPIEGGDIVVMSGFYYMQGNIPPNFMVFWRPEADDWVYVEEVGGNTSSRFYTSNAFYMGQYFSNDIETGITNVIDIATKKLAYQVAPPEGTNPLRPCYTILVESGGKILRLLQHYYEVRQCHFHIYCLYFGDSEGKPCWVKITDIGDQMLFL